MWADREQLSFEIKQDVNQWLEWWEQQNKKVLTPIEGTQGGGQTGTQNKTLLDDTEHFVNDTVMKPAVGNTQKALVGIQIQIQQSLRTSVFQIGSSFFQKDN